MRKLITIVLMLVMLLVPTAGALAKHKKHHGRSPASHSKHHKKKSKHASHQHKKKKRGPASASKRKHKHKKRHHR